MPTVNKSKVTVKVHSEDRAITAQKAKDLLGWITEREEEDFEKDYLLKDTEGVKVRTTKNTKNRPLYKSIVAFLKQEMLRGRWKLNGDTIIIGEHGSILDGQHTLISLILANEELEADPEAFPEVEYPLTIDKLVVTGVAEDDATVNTINTGKSRTLTDVIYRSPYFESLSNTERKKLSKVLDNAVKFLWFRTGLNTDSYALKKTHSESLNFIDNHQTIINSAKFIYELNQGNTKLIARWIPLGAASGLHYLMSCSASDHEKYYSETEHAEDKLDFSNYQLASEFFELFANEDPKIKPVATALKKLIENYGDSIFIRTALFIKAWIAFSSGKKINNSSLNLKFVEDEYGDFSLAENPVVDGIDKGTGE